MPAGGAEAQGGVRLIRLKVVLGALATAVVFIAALMGPAGSQPQDPRTGGLDDMMQPGRARPEHAVSRSGDDARACNLAREGRWEEAEEHASSEGMRGLIRARRTPAACPNFTPTPAPES